jgi:hypothetical protein
MIDYSRLTIGRELALEHVACTAAGATRVRDPNSGGIFNQRNARALQKSFIGPVNAQLCYSHNASL